jgi:hypothetical protein
MMTANEKRAITDARHEAVIQAVRDGLSAHELATSKLHLFSATGNVAMAYQKVVAARSRLAQRRIITKTGHGSYVIHEGHKSLPPPMVEPPPTIPFTAAPTVSTQLPVFPPEKDWTPLDLLVWLSSFKGLDRLDLAARLTPDCIDKAITVARRSAGMKTHTGTA